MGFKQEKDAIWARWERSYRTLFSQEFRDAVENQQGAYVDEETWLKDLDDYIPQAIQLGKALLGANNVVSDRTKAEPQKRYRKPFERRFHLVKFVTESSAHDSSTRFNWQRIAAEWNAAYPFEQIKPEVLRVEYNRAIQEDDLVTQLLAIKSAEEVVKIVQARLDNPPRKLKPTPEFHRFFSQIARSRRTALPIKTSDAWVEIFKTRPDIRERIERIVSEVLPAFRAFNKRRIKKLLLKKIEMENLKVRPGSEEVIDEAISKAISLTDPPSGLQKRLVKTLLPILKKSEDYYNTLVEIEASLGWLKEAMIKKYKEAS